MTSQDTAPYIRGHAPAWTASEDETLTANQHRPLDEIVPLLPRRSRDSIYQRLQARGVKITRGKHPSEWSDEDVAYLRENYGKVPSEELCKRLGRKQHAITEYARKRGLFIPKDENGDTVNTRDNASLRPLLNGSLQSYYWMGYLMADGYMHHGLGQIVLVSAKADKKHMATYAAYLNAEAHQYDSIGGYTGLPTEHCRVSVAERRWAARIAEAFDWKPRKTYNPPSREVLERTLANPDDFIAFLIGFIDGDGHINRALSTRLENHASWLPFHDFLLDMLRTIGMLDSNLRAAINGCGYSDFDLPKRVTLQLKTFILRHNLTVLTRKWDKVHPISS